MAPSICYPATPASFKYQPDPLAATPVPPLSTESPIDMCVICPHPSAAHWCAHTPFGSSCPAQLSATFLRSHSPFLLEEVVFLLGGISFELVHGDIVGTRYMFRGYAGRTWCAYVPSNDSASTVPWAASRYAFRRIVTSFRSGPWNTEPLMYNT